MAGQGLCLHGILHKAHPKIYNSFPTGLCVVLKSNLGGRHPFLNYITKHQELKCLLYLPCYFATKKQPPAMSWVVQRLLGFIGSGQGQKLLQRCLPMLMFTFSFLMSENMVPLHPLLLYSMWTHGMRVHLGLSRDKLCIMYVQEANCCGKDQLALLNPLWQWSLKGIPTQKKLTWKLKQDGKEKPLSAQCFGEIVWGHFIPLKSWPQSTATAALELFIRVSEEWVHQLMLSHKSITRHDGKRRPALCGFSWASSVPRSDPMAYSPDFLRYVLNPASWKECWFYRLTFWMEQACYCVCWNYAEIWKKWGRSKSWIELLES